VFSKEGEAVSKSAIRSGCRIVVFFSVVVGVEEEEERVFSSGVKRPRAIAFPAGPSPSVFLGALLFRTYGSASPFFMIKRNPAAVGEILSRVETRTTPLRVNHRLRVCSAFLDKRKEFCFLFSFCLSCPVVRRWTAGRSTRGKRG